MELPSDLPAEFSVRISGVTLDSRQVKPGDLFFACFGRNHDARDYIDQAIAKGAVAVLAHAGGQWQGVEVRKGVIVLAIDDLAARTGLIASRFFDEPSAAMQMIGVTGTNGKTSCTQFIAQALNAMEHRCGVIGTLGIGVPPLLEDSSYTTPDPVQVQSALASLRGAGADTVAMEVSSQGLHQYRVNGVRFDVAVFTNLTRDHLDYHGSMDEYFETKRRLFLMEGLSSAVVNIDDAYATGILNSLAPTVRSYTYSLANPNADVYATALELNRQGYRAQVHTPFGDGELQGALLGSFNFSNLLAVLTSLLALQSAQPDFDLARLFRQMSRLQPVAGRMEIVGGESDITVVVDYAHTPDALRVTLQALREHFSGQLWCVFGCGGNRDQGKRPIMAEMAETYADRLIVTDDNPRRENADEIVRQILLGVEDTSRLIVERDRARAIETAIVQARAGDVVLVAGKGHENYQDVNGHKTVFSDVNQARLALAKRKQQRNG
ncbi:MAG: UDP-N-acetylmuramoyl-L-alanyl-D-glutamate--2,6-diaminopimelate ligase [Pseudomonadales bacterium]|nr:UDP-N-acetylmuramoyl-L-alanyl-D-glutamate--2,6-diaminopimelate ligase [Pseudomonadales bacterium]MCP5358763.1 UDP-N-acetylmuramoyl-L-alanyl-D-glutamate--2,6-diaminopimelate ligase [Pseudomonadales bacterium]